MIFFSFPALFSYFHFPFLCDEYFRILCKVLICAFIYFLLHSSQQYCRNITHSKLKEKRKRNRKEVTDCKTSNIQIQFSSGNFNWFKKLKHFQAFIHKSSYENERSAIQATELSSMVQFRLQKRSICSHSLNSLQICELKCFHSLNGKQYVSNVLVCPFS